MGAALAFLVIPVILIFGIGSLAQNAKNSAEDECATAYKVDAEKGLADYKLKNGVYPNTLSDLTRANVPNLSDYDFCSERLEYSVSGSTFSLSIKK